MLTSDVTPIGSAARLTLEPHIPHGVAWIEFFASSDPSGAKVVPTAGTVTLAGILPGEPGYTVALTDGAIPADAPELRTWSAPFYALSASTSGITGATHYRVVVYQYVS